MYSIPPAKQLFADADSPRELSERREEFIAEMTKATVATEVGATVWGSPVDQDPGFNFPIPTVRSNAGRADAVAKAMAEVEMAKSTPGSGEMVKAAGRFGANSEILAKEWTLTNPVGTGLVPFDLEAPAKLLTPRPTPIRNSTPRLKGQGGARRFKVISGFTGTGTGGITTTQPGINESSTNTGPGGLSYVRGPYINYAGFDVTLNYVTTSLSDSVSWQAGIRSAA